MWAQPTWKSPMPHAAKEVEKLAEVQGVGVAAEAAIAGQKPGRARRSFSPKIGSRRTTAVEAVVPTRGTSFRTGLRPRDRSAEPQPANLGGPSSVAHLGPQGGRCGRAFWSNWAGQASEVCVGGGKPRKSAWPGQEQHGGAAKPDCPPPRSRWSQSPGRIHVRDRKRAKSRSSDAREHPCSMANAAR